MNLTKSQKKFLKNNLKILSPGQLAKGLGVTENDLKNYLKKHLSKDRFEKIYSKKSEEVAGENKNFSLKKFVKNNWKSLVFLAILVFAVYFNSLGNEFLSDDITAIRDNPDIANLNPGGGISFVFNLRNVLLAITYRVFGLKPLFFRLTNILCHLGSTLVLFILMNFFFSSSIPFFTACLFAVHPFLTEGIVWISGGPYSISTFIILTAFLCYLKAREGKNLLLYLLTIFIFYLALSQAVQAVVFAGIVIWYEIVLGDIKLNWKKTISFILTSILWMFYLFGLLGKRVNTLQTSYYQESGLYNPFTQIPTAISSYLQLIFWPIDLTLYHSEMAFSTPQYISYLAVTGGFFTAVVYFLKKDKRIFFWLTFFIIALLPSLTPLKIAWIVAERYAYMASIGIFVLIAYFIQKLSDRINYEKLPYLVLAAIVPLLSWRTIVRNIDWKNQDNLWLAAAKTSPSSPQNHNNLGDLYSRRGEFEKAVKEFKTAISLLPNYGDAYHNLANTYLQMNNLDLAIEGYKNALKYNPRLWQSHQNLAAIYIHQGNFELAKQHLGQALEIDPENQKLRETLQQLLSNPQ